MVGARATDFGVGLHQMAAHLGSFDPNDIQKNYVADAGWMTGGPGLDYYSFTVPPLTDFVLV